MSDGSSKYEGPAAPIPKDRIIGSTGFTKRERAALDMAAALLVATGAAAYSDEVLGKRANALAIAVLDAAQ